MEDAPDSWAPPLPDAASIHAGRELWRTASLVANSLPNSPRIQAHCGDCHTQDGRDLKYFNFSNESIISRARFHGLSTLQSEQIASYIRSLPVPNPGRPWNPPYQPGPGVDEQPLSNWAAGADSRGSLRRIRTHCRIWFASTATSLTQSPQSQSGDAPDLRELVRQITPAMFHPDGNLSAREIPIALQLPDWNQWLPRVHPKDAWGTAFLQESHCFVAALYDGEGHDSEKQEQDKQEAAALHPPPPPPTCCSSSSSPPSPPLLPGGSGPQTYGSRSSPHHCRLGTVV